MDFAVACPKCGFSNMKVDIPTDTIKTNEEVPTEILPQDILNFANIKKLLSKNAGDVVTAEDIF